MGARVVARSRAPRGKLRAASGDGSLRSFWNGRGRDAASTCALRARATKRAGKMPALLRRRFLRSGAYWERSLVRVHQVPLGVDLPAVGDEAEVVGDGPAIGERVAGVGGV